MVAQEEPDLFSVVEPGVELLVTWVAFVVVAKDTLSNKLYLDESVSLEVLVHKSHCVLEDVLEVSLCVYFVFECWLEFLVLHCVALLFEELDDLS